MKKETKEGLVDFAKLLATSILVFVILAFALVVWASNAEKTREEEGVVWCAQLAYGSVRCYRTLDTCEDMTNSHRVGTCARIFTGLR